MTCKFSFRPTLAAALLCTTLALVLLSKTAVVPASAATPRVESPNAEQIIETLMDAIKRSRKPPPVWALDTALLAYKTWRTYRNGLQVEEVRKEVTAVLKVVAQIKDDVEAGREMSDREYRRTRELLDARGRRLGDLTGRVRVLEKRHQEMALQVLSCLRRARRAEGRIFRRSCGVGHAWRNGRCVNVIANPR